jgi:alpha-1,3-rhamnosyl/mannosyltransferase
LKELYAHADLLAYPSLDEGFGFPILEAMSSGTPVVTADRGAPPEISGGAAVTVDPTDTRAISQAFERVLTDHTLSTQLAEKGLIRAREFSWERAAAETLAVYRKAAEDHR